MKMRTIGLAAIVIWLTSLPLDAATHRDCSDYCEGNPSCHQAIESQHESMGGCTNYGYGSAGLIIAGEHCSTSYDPRNRYIWNTMDCDEGGNCQFSGILQCLGGNFPLPNDPPITCGPGSLTGSVKVEIDRNSVTCTWATGNGMSVTCGPNGLLTVAW